MNRVYVKGVNSELCCFEVATAAELMARYSEATGVPQRMLRASRGSRPVVQLDAGCTVLMSLRVEGGKGGFGSLLKGQGMIARVDNFDACRDLNGRRIRDVNNEIRLAQWNEKQAEKRQKLKELESTEVVLPAKRSAIDKTYKQELNRSVQGVRKALAEGMKKKINKD